MSYKRCNIIPEHWLQPQSISSRCLACKTWSFQPEQCTSITITLTEVSLYLSPQLFHYFVSLLTTLCRDVHACILITYPVWQCYINGCRLAHFVGQHGYNSSCIYLWETLPIQRSQLLQTGFICRPLQYINIIKSYRHITDWHTIMPISLSHSPPLKFTRHTSPPQYTNTHITLIKQL